MEPIMGHCTETQLWLGFTLCFWGNNCAVLLYTNLLPFSFKRHPFFLRNGNCLRLVENPPIMFHKRSAYMPSEGGDYPLCVAPLRLCCLLYCQGVLQSRSASTCRRADILASSTWLICGREYCVLHGGVGQWCPRLGLRWCRRLACIVGLWCEHQTFFLYLARHGLWSSIIPSAFIFWLFFFFCASPQFDSTPAVFDCIRDELWDFSREAHYSHNTRTINSRRLRAKFPNSLGLDEELILAPVVHC